MIQFKALIERFEEKGEKTGWTYIEVSEEMAAKLLPANKKAFRVKGYLDDYPFSWVALIPMGDGSFILPLNAEIRKGIKKEKGDLLVVQMELDKQEKPLCQELILCLEEVPEAFNFYQSLPKGHQRYFSNWIESAKTESTRTKRITQAVVALEMGLGYPEMVRMNKRKKEEGNL